MLISEDRYSPPNPEKLAYHCVWFGSLLKHHVLSIASLIETQENPSVWIWTDSDSFEKLRPLERIFRGRDLRVVVGDWIREMPSYDAITFRSDVWRMEILNRHGGVYFDLDVLFLKDISWVSTYGRCIVQEGFASERVFNTAIMYSPAEYPGLQRMREDVFRDGHYGWERLFTIQSYDNLEKFGAHMLPNRVTDLGWVEGGFGFDPFFHQVGADPDAISGCIVYHWHNRWDSPVDTPGTVVAHYWNKWAAPYWEKHLGTA